MQITYSITKEFKDWLSICGALVLASRNEYEVVRFRTGRGLSTIGMNKMFIITAMTGESRTAWKAFTMGLPWNGGFKTPRTYDGRQRHNLLRELSARDDWQCTYCGKLLSIGTATIEHVISLTRGGSDCINNMVLACEQCNNEAGHLNIRRKIELILRKRRPLKEQAMMTLTVSCPECQKNVEVDTGYQGIYWNLLGNWTTEFCDIKCCSCGCTFDFDIYCNVMSGTEDNKREQLAQYQ